MTREEFDEYWVDEAKKYLASKVAKINAEIKRLEKEIKDDPNNPINSIAKSNIEKLKADLLAENERLVSPIKKPSEFMDDNQYRWHQGIDKALAEGKNIPNEVLKIILI